MSTIGIFLFIFAILFSIGLHEFGHLLTAKWAGMKVDQYFIGFGTKLWSFRKGETEYGVKLWPLGGFVKIAGMNPFEEVAPEDRHRVFAAKPAWKRAIVLAAGSFTHFLLALVIIVVVMSIVGKTGDPTTTVAAVEAEFAGKDSPAKAAGLEPGDTVVALDGTEVETWPGLVDMISARAGRTVPLAYERDGQRLRTGVTIAYAVRACETDGPLIRPAEAGADQVFGYLGVEPKFRAGRPVPTVAKVVPELDGRPTPAARAGFERGDRVVRVGTKRVTSWNHLIERVHGSPGEVLPVVAVRDGERVRLDPKIASVHKSCEGRPGIAPVAEYAKFAGAELKVVGFLGVGPSYERLEVGFVSAVGEAGELIGRGVVESLNGLKNLFSPASIGRLFATLANQRDRAAEDPATIVGLTQQAGGLAEAGAFDTFFLLIAAFNIFIGVANLLPLPPLDGGHLAVLAYEKVRRRKVDMQRLLPITATVILLFGTMFLLLLMLDITKPLPGIPG